MLQTLVTLIAGGALTFGVGSGSAFVGNLSASQKDELSQAKQKAVAVLSDAEKAYISSLDGKSMRDLSYEEKAKIRAIKEEIHDATVENISDAELKAQLEENHQQRVAKRGNGNGQRQHRNQ